MKLEYHRVKAERIERSIACCGPADYEMVIEGAMLAGTHWFNIVLHRTTLMPVERDAMHAEFMTVGERRKMLATAPDALHALDEIERLRTPYVRGDMPGGERAAQVALDCLARLRRMATAGVAQAGAAH